MKSLTRWEDPFAGLTSLHSQLDDMFNDMFGTGRLAATSSAPAMNVYSEDDKNLVAELEAPGFDKEDIQINIHEGVLEIKGEKKTREEQKDKKRTYMVSEMSSSFFRRIALPKHADGDNIQANFQDGILKVTVPFKELPKPKQIQIQGGGKK